MADTPNEIGQPLQTRSPRVVGNKPSPSYWQEKAKFDAEVKERLETPIDTSLTFKKAGTVVGAEQAVNFIDGTNIAVTVADDTTNSEVDVTVGITGQVAIANGGTGQATAQAAFNALDPLTTKGDIIVHDGTNSVRQAVGANGQHLVADSAQANGLKWDHSEQYGIVGSGDFTTASTSPVDLTGLTSFSLDVNGQYSIELFIWYSQSAAGTATFSFSAPAAPTAVIASRENQTAPGVSTDAMSTNDPDTAYPSVAVTQTSLRFIRLVGGIINGANAGTFKIQVKSSIGTTTVTVKAGTWCRLRRIA